MQIYLEKLMNHEDLSREEMKAATLNCFSDNITDAEMAGFLIALRSKGETSDEITGMVEVIRSHSDLSNIKLPDVMDNCGTGGDKSDSFNISTTSSFVIAGAGITIAKHGNRSISSKTGSADVLEHLGVSLSFSKDHVEEMLNENQIAFLFAPHVHAKLKHFMKIRKQLGLPTIFNTIGPLTNPITLDSQMLGVYREDMLYMIADSLHKLGRRRALVVNGAGSMDEASLAGENKLILLERGDLIPFTLHPEEVGLPVYSNTEIKGGNAKENAAILESILDGKKGAYRDTVLLNAGLALFTNGIAEDIKSGIEIAKESIDSGSARARLARLVEYSQKNVRSVM